MTSFATPLTPVNRTVAFKVKSDEASDVTPPVDKESETSSPDKASGVTPPVDKESGTSSPDKASGVTPPADKESGTSSPDKASGVTPLVDYSAAAEVAARGLYPDKVDYPVEYMVANDAAIGALAALPTDASPVQMVQQAQGGAAAAGSALNNGASVGDAILAGAITAPTATQAINENRSSPEARIEAQMAAEKTGVSHTAALAAADTATSTAVVSKEIEALELGNIVYTPPQTIGWKSSATTELDLSLQYSVEELKLQIANDQKEGKHIQVSNTMEALLEGPNFKISQATPTRQAVSSQRTTSWTWDIVPASVGTHPLHMTLSALIDVQGQLTPVAFKVYDQSVEVNKTLPQHIEEFFSNNWQWLWTVLLVPVAGWLWRKHTRVKKNARNAGEKVHPRKLVPRNLHRNRKPRV